MAKPANHTAMASPRLLISRVPVPVLDHLHDPATLLPTAPDLTLIAPRTPTNQSSMSFSSPAPSLVLDLDTTPLSIRLSDDVPQSPDSIRLGGNEPSGVNNQQTHSVASGQVLGACESSQARKGPWNVLGRLTPGIRPKNHPNRPISSSLADKPHRHPSSLLSAKAPMMLPRLNRSQSARLPSSPMSSPPPALSPPRVDPQIVSQTTRPKATKRVSAWLSPMKYDQDAQELVVSETGEIGTCVRTSVQDPLTGTKTGAQDSSAKKLRRSSAVSSFVPSWVTGHTFKSNKTTPALVVDTHRTSLTEDEEPNSSQSATSSEQAQRQAHTEDPPEGTIDGSRSKQPRLFGRLRTIKIKQIW